MADGFLIGASLLGRIRDVVNERDGSIRKEEPYRIQTRFEGGNGVGGKVFRIGSFTGSWSIDQQKVVTLRGSTATLSALNLFSNISVDCGTRDCAVAKDGTAWYLIAARCT